MDTKAIGKLIREERINQRLTGEELGAKVGVGKAQISKIENGSATTLSSITKVAEGLGVSLGVRIIKNTTRSKKVVGYIIACINVFAETFGMTTKEATNYLSRYKGVDFLSKHYEAEHLLSIEDAVQDLANICYNNGGGVR